MIASLDSIHVLVLGAIPPLSRPRKTDRHLGIERWLVLAVPSTHRVTR